MPQGGRVCLLAQKQHQKPLSGDHHDHPPVFIAHLWHLCLPTPAGQWSLATGDRPKGCAAHCGRVRRCWGVAAAVLTRTDTTGHVRLMIKPKLSSQDRLPDLRTFREDFTGAWFVSTITYLFTSSSSSCSFFKGAFIL